jgi:hypothetical protein
MVCLGSCLINVNKPLECSPAQTDDQTYIYMKAGDRQLFKVFGTINIPDKKRVLLESGLSG